MVSIGQNSGVSLPMIRAAGMPIREEDEGKSHVRENIRWLDAVIFTHSHADHVMAWTIAGDFATCAAATRAGLCNEATMNDLKRVFAYAFHGGPGQRLFYPERISSTGRSNWAIWRLFLPLPHGSMARTVFCSINRAVNGWRT